MAAIVVGDVSIDSSGNIRWTGSATTPRHTVLEFIQFLMDKQDDEQAAGNDLLDITVDTPFNRSTDQIVTLNSPFNIDDTFATHLYDGSVSQTEPTLGEETLYSGFRVIGPVETGTEYMILQNGNVLPAFWGTGINAEAAPSLVFSRHLVKSKVAGVDIDGKRITVLARELGDQYRRFPATLGTANSVAAIGNGADIFNAKTDATIAAFTTIINTEGFQELDIDGTGAAGQEFYSQWATGSQTINDTYERTKWISQRSHSADSNTETGNNFVVDDNDTTALGRGTEFSATAAGEVLTTIRVRIKNGGGTPTGTLYMLLYDSDDASPAAPTGAILGRSEPVLASAITSAYEDVLFQFNRFDPSDGTDQLSTLTLVANQKYFLFLKNDEGTAANFFHVEGDTTSADDGNVAVETPAGTFAGTASQALNFDVRTSPAIHGIAGDRFEGINIEAGFDGELGTGIAENNIAMWGTLVSYDTLVNGPFRPGEFVTFKTGSTLKSGGIVLYDDGTDELVVALDSAAALVLTDGDVITSVRGASETTAVVDFPAYTGNGSTDLDFATATPGTITRVGGSFITDGFKAGHKLVVTGSVSNNGTFNISTVTPPTALVITVLEATTSEVNVAATVTLAAKDEDLSGGTGIILAKDDNGATGEVYLQVLTGVNPVNNSRIRRDDVSGDPLVDYADATATLNTRTINPEYLGTSTGSNIIGSYGIGFVPGDVGSSDRFTSLDNTSRVPPNNVVFTVSALVSGEDRVLVGPRTGSALDRGQWLLATALTGAGETAVVVKTGTDTVPWVAGEINWPATGGAGDPSAIRVQLDNGIYKNQDYTSHDSVDTFTIPSTAYNVDGAAINNNVFIAFIDVLADATTETFTGVHTGGSDRTLFVRVRDGGGTPIKTFESTTAQFLSTPQTIAAVRTSDA